VDLTNPIGQVEYTSSISGVKEKQAITENLMAPTGCEYSRVAAQGCCGDHSRFAGKSLMLLHFVDRLAKVGLTVKQQTPGA
jgi:hypothetical protein